MGVGSIIGYVIAVALIAWALWRRAYSVRAQRIAGNLQLGDNSGTINQTYSGAAREQAQPDRVGWAILIIGVLVAVAQLAHDIFWAK